MILFEVLTRRQIRNDRFVARPALVRSVEKSVEFILQLGDDLKGFDMKSFLQATNKQGETLFHSTTLFSERLSAVLLQREILVNSVDSHFQTPDFNVSKVKIFCYDDWHSFLAI